MSTYHPKNKLAVAVSAALVVFSTASLAQEKPGKNAGPVEEVIVTGSAIVREDLEGSLPIQILDVADIARTGVTNTGDLVAQLPAMQGFTTPADSVGGGGGGIQTASIHDIGEQYTLTLLNGRRMASATSGATVDLRAIPVSVVENVEVLTDGASALYGSDAIAGVVNFKLKEEVDETRISLSYDAPLESGGEVLAFDLSTGFGSFDEDGYSFVMAVSHEEREQLKSTDRDFAKSGILTVNHPGLGQDGIFFRGSGNAIPGNARVRYMDNDKVDDPKTPADDRITTYIFNPYYLNNGNKCAENNAPILSGASATSDAGQECYFDFTSTIEIIPKQESDSLFLSGRVAINDNLTAFGRVTYTDSTLESRIAPYPTGWVPLPSDSQLVKDEILPHLNDKQKGNILNVFGRWRSLAAGNRTTIYDSQALNTVFGLEGSFDDIEYTTAISYGRNDQTQDYPTGWLLADEFNALVSSGGLNIFTDAASLPDSEKAALAGAVYSGEWETTETETIAFDASGTKPLFQMAGGESVLAAGIDYRQSSYVNELSPANQGTIKPGDDERTSDILFLGVGTPYDLSRSQWGIFAEYFMPVLDSVELSASVRYDSIGSVQDDSTFLLREASEIANAARRNLGGTKSDVTYKLSARWDATDELALRASYGTGFKAPSMRQIADPLSDFGVTSGSFKCPFEATDSLAALCQAGLAQYNVSIEGNAELKAEKSKQFTGGFVYRPANGINITVDYWSVEIEDVIQTLDEAEIFNNPVLYRDLFSARKNTSTGEDELAIIQRSVNGGTLDASGIDYSFSQSIDTAVGEVTSSLSGTYMLKSETSLSGSSLGRFGNNNAVTFRNRMQFNVRVDHGIFSHGITANFRSGYRDQGATINLIDPKTGEPDFGTNTQVQLYVPSYTTFDYQAKLDLMDDQLTLTGGIKNLTDKQPPLSLRNSGAGHQVGWDPRYVDAYGRTVYLKASFGF
ncbi:TonB-dependent receptor domain-containing protein [Marinagarivorans algicola]|uniref:TonB-dependent receptor domain-containing protein n=1 Tax=Marinagarivorans algicola TaxID=1513270 RepID=UPI0006B996BD|nr:TonB-dependent receptor [Marinagarivorans algicola]